MTIVDNKKIAKNTLALFFRMMVLMFVNLYASRLILKYLGVDDFGIYNVVGGIVSLFTFIGGAMTHSTQRYLNFYLGKSDNKNLRIVFNASLRIHFIFALLIILLCETIGLWFLNNFMNIPSERMVAANYVLQFSIIATAFVIMSYPYNANVIAREKMNAYAYLSIYEAIVKLIIVYFLSIATFDKLIVYAALYMLVQISVTFFYKIYCYRNFPESHFSKKGISKKIIRELINFSGWNFLGNISHVCLIQGTNLLLNIFFGPSVNAAKAISVQVQHAVNMFFTNFQTAQNPQIVKTYAANDLLSMNKLMLRSSRFSFILGLIISIPIFYRVDEILLFWLETVPDYSGVFVKYVLGFSLLQTLALPIHTGCLATGKIKWLMISTSFIFWSIIPVGYLLLKITENPISIFLLQLVLYLLAQIIRLLIINKLVNLSIIEYFKEVLFPISVVTIFSLLISKLFANYFGGTFIQLFLFGISSALLTIIIAYIFGIKYSEKKAILTFLKSKLHI